MMQNIMGSTKREHVVLGHFATTSGERYIIPTSALISLFNALKLSRCSPTRHTPVVHLPTPPFSNIRKSPPQSSHIMEYKPAKYPSHWCISKRTTPTEPKNRWEVQPGVLSDGTMTIRHPWVSQYLDALGREYQKIVKPMFYWAQQSRAIQKLGTIEGVNKLLNINEELDETRSSCVLALAALKVFGSINHAAHFALWGRPTDMRSAKVVYEVLYHQPQLIESPFYWMGNQEMLRLLHRHHSFAFPVENAANPKNEDEEDRDEARREVEAYWAREAEGGESIVPAGVRRVVKAGTPPKHGIPVAASPSSSSMSDENEEVDVVLLEATGSTTARRSLRQAIKCNRAQRSRGSSTAVSNTPVEAQSSGEPQSKTRRMQKRGREEAEEEHGCEDEVQRERDEVRPTRRARRPSTRTGTR